MRPPGREGHGKCSYSIGFKSPNILQREEMCAEKQLFHLSPQLENSRVRGSKLQRLTADSAVFTRIGRVTSHPAHRIHCTAYTPGGATALPHPRGVNYSA